MSAGKTVTAEYLDGIKEGREWFKREGMENARAHLDNLVRTCRGFDASSPVGQMLRASAIFGGPKSRKGNRNEKHKI